MTEYVFRTKNGRAQLVKGDAFPTERAILRLEDGRPAVLLIAGRRTEIPSEGAYLTAAALPSGMHTPLILSNGERFEGPPVAVFAGTLFFLPPTHERLAAAEAGAEEAHEKIAVLEKRVRAIEDRIQNTNIF